MVKVRKVVESRRKGVKQGYKFMKRFSPVFLDSGYIGGYMGQNRGKRRRNGGTKAARD